VVASFWSRVVTAIGAQMIVPDLDSAVRRIEACSSPLDDARASTRKP
jgi:hypothetical protein